MSVDRLQEKIRKMKSPVILDFVLSKELIPTEIIREEGEFTRAYTKYAVELLDNLRDVIPGVRFHFSSFAVLGTDGLTMLSRLMDYSKKLGYYVILDAPEALTAQQAAQYAPALMGGDAVWHADGIVVSCYIGSDALKPYVALLKESGAGLFAVVRTGNKSAAEQQDLLTGSRLSHIAQADMINRLAQPYLGKSIYCGLGAVGAATAPDSLRNLRSKYPYLFLIVDGYDNANGKNCSYAFDKLGHGAVVCVGTSIMGAWMQEESEGGYVACAVSSAERIKKNIGKYVTVL